MTQPVRRVDRLLEAAARREAQQQIMNVTISEHGVLRALARAFGENPPPLLVMDEPEPDMRAEYVKRIMVANEPQAADALSGLTASANVEENLWQAK